MTSVDLPLRDVHDVAAPHWWPPAPGWWVVFALALLMLAAFAWMRWRRVARRKRAALLFDTTVAAAATPALQVAAISQLLRRAALRIDPAAAARDGDDWLQLLDRGLPQPVFSTGAGQLLRDGAFRPEVEARSVDALREAARARFLDWMERHA